MKREINKEKYNIAEREKKSRKNWFFFCILKGQFMSLYYDNKLPLATTKTRAPSQKQLRISGHPFSMSIWIIQLMLDFSIPFKPKGSVKQEHFSFKNTSSSTFHKKIITFLRDFKKINYHSFINRFWLKFLWILKLWDFFLVK